MNILYISYDGALDPLGSSQILPYIRKLSERGARITLLSYEKSGELKNKEKLERLAGALKNKDVGWKMLRYHKRLSFIATSFDIINGLAAGLQIILSRKIQIIHARSFVGAIPGFVLAKIMNVKFIFDMRGFWPDERVEGDIWPGKGLLYRIAKWWEKLFLTHSDSVVCLTQEAKKIIEGSNLLSDKKPPVEVIPTCVDTGVFCKREKDAQLLNKLKLENRFVFFYSGSLGTWYMFDEMIEFFKIAKSIEPRSFFLLLTRDKEYVDYRMRVFNVNVNDFYVDFVEYKDVPRWLSLADGSISFIKPTYSKKSSCPTKFAESLACAIPVIINNGVGDTANLTRQYDTGVVIDKFDKDEYRKACVEFFLKSRDKLKMQSNCQRLVQDVFSLDRGVERYFKIYGKLSANQSKKVFFPLLESETPFVSMVFPNFNGGEFIIKTINSLKDLNYPPECFEIIIVDNGSSDGSTEAIKNNFAKEINSNRIKLIELGKNAGAPFAYNTGIKNIDKKSQFILKMDNDIILDRDCLRQLLAPFRRFSDVAISGGKVLYYTENDRIHLIGTSISPLFAGGRGIGKYKIDNNRFDKDFRIDAVNGCLMLIRKGLFEKIGLMDENYFLYFDDIDFSLRAKRKGLKQMYCYRARAYHNTAVPKKRFQSERWLHYAIYNSFYYMKKNYQGCSSFIFFLAINANMARYMFNVLLHNHLKDSKRLIGLMLDSYKKGMNLPLNFKNY